MMGLFSTLPDAFDRQASFQSDVRAFMIHQSVIHDQLLENHKQFQTEVFETLRGGDSKQRKQLANMSASLRKSSQEQADFHVRLLREITSSNPKDPSVTNSMLQRVLKGLTHYIAGTQELCPRWVIVEIPNEKPTSRPRGAVEWLRGLAKIKVHLYLVCQHSHRRMPEPIVLEINRQWIVQIAPVLSYTLLALKLACETGASKTIASFLPSNVLVEQYAFYRELLSKSWEEDALEALDDLSKQLEQGEASRRAVSVSSSAGGSSSQVTKLTEQSYRILSEKLSKEKRSWWREKMLAVTDKDGHVIYVLKEYANLYTEFYHGVNNNLDTLTLETKQPSNAVGSGKTVATEVSCPGDVHDDELWC